MPRLRNPRSGVVVDVDDATADQIRSGYEPADAPEPKASATRKRAAAKSDTSK